MRYEVILAPDAAKTVQVVDRKSTRLNSSHGYISYAVFCLKKHGPALPGARRAAADRGRERRASPALDASVGSQLGQPRLCAASHVAPPRRVVLLNRL